MKTTITLLAAGFAVSAAHAQIEYTAQDRWVEIQAFFPTGTQSDSRAIHRPANSAGQICMKAN